ncbi:DUF6807 family protein [Zhihengliuella flava]|uniref:Dehydrogenase n=1 Tax=Zhihengliuella flava TaxID=1285193 RepID=A0A931D8F7_9MICC|nr:DUF6807 family protein [Zhihengliuella flava]MBG6084309.1 putative dehydrogenase [Zhihengliuella flava]
MSARDGVVLIGLNGFGRQHLINIERLVAAGKMELLAGVDFSDPGPDVRGAQTPVFSSLAEVAAAGIRPDIVIVSTPISTHHPIALEALELGADLYLEKPPTATLAQYHELLAAAEAAGARVQVGFQSIGSHALPHIADLLSPTDGSGPLGTLRAVGASGTWVRTRGYYQRAPWAGHRVLNGVEVVDGVATNPLAHAVQTALHIGGATGSEDVVRLDTELHHAHPIEADDTTTLSIGTAAGLDITCALTVCAGESADPWITIYGTEGQAVFYYTRDELVITPNADSPSAGAGEQRQSFGRTNLLENLIDVRAGAATELLSPLSSAGGFMRVLEAIRTADDPAQIPREHVFWEGEGDDEHPVIPHIEDLIDRAVKGGTTFSSLRAPWAKRPETSGELTVCGTARPVTVAELRTGADISPTNGPRPFLDQVRTLSGVVLTDQQPLDHPWHLGVSVAVQDVDGINFWGGRTYTRDAGRYVWRADHGRIVTTSQSVVTDAHDDGTSGQRWRAALDWVGPDGSVALQERRQVSTRHRGDGWELDIEFELSPAGESDVVLGSPGSNGRAGGGYGGYFWRLPELKNARVFTAEAEGEDAVHGTVSEWLAVTADFSSTAGHPLTGTTAEPATGSGRGPSTLIFISADDDPWFVRQSGYPGIGASLAWDAPVTASAEAPVRRRIRTLILDGVLPPAEIAERVAALSGAPVSTH